jgi:hypothetical protein
MSQEKITGFMMGVSVGVAIGFLLKALEDPHSIAQGFQSVTDSAQTAHNPSRAPIGQNSQERSLHPTAQ